MSIRDLEISRDLRKVGDKLGREGIAKRALAIAKQIVEEDSYKNAIAGIGRMSALGLCCGSDSYWREKREIGRQKEIGAIESWGETGKWYDKIQAVR